MKNSLVLLLLCVMATNAHAQETPDTISLRELVVTATRLPVARSSVPAAVTVITGEELRRRGIRTIDEALRSVSGATVVETGSYGATTSLFLRAGQSDHVQLMIDGVQINSPGEPINWNNVALENVERIEIVKGPTSVLYGSDAATGVVHLITRTRSGAPRGELLVTGGLGDKVGAQADGTFGSGSFKAEIAGGAARLSCSAGASHFTTDGAYAFNNRHRNSSLTSRLVWSANAATSVSLSARYSKNRFHYPTNGLGQLSDQNQYHEGEVVAAGLEGARRLSERTVLRAALVHNQNLDITDDRADNAADTTGFFRYHSKDEFRRQTADVRIDYLVSGNSTLTVGGEAEWQSNRGQSSSPFGDTPDNTEKRNNRAAYAQLLAARQRYSVQAGVRAEDNQRFGNVATYRAGATAHLSRSLRARASAGTGFKEPRFFEQFGGGFVTGNPDLEPERSRSAEMGVDAHIGNATVSGSFFAQKFSDLIQYITPANFGDPNYVNVAGAHANGVEIEATWTANRFSVNGSYTLLQTEITDQGDASDVEFVKGETLVRRPKHSGSVVVSTAFARATATLTGFFVGERADLDFASFPATRVTLDSYTRVDLATEYRLTGAAGVSLKVENLFDASYEEVLNFPARGRVAYLGARVSF